MDLIEVLKLDERFGRVPRCNISGNLARGTFRNGTRHLNLPTSGHFGDDFNIIRYQSSAAAISRHDDAILHLKVLTSISLGDLASQVQHGVSIMACIQRRSEECRFFLKVTWLAEYTLRTREAAEVVVFGVRCKDDAAN
jgi:hypothetical protein